MKRPTKSFAKTTSNLYQSIHQQVNTYAVVALVSLLGLALPSEAKIVYTTATVSMYNNGQYKLDLNHDGIADFTLHEVFEETDPCGRLGPFITRYLGETPAQGGGAADDTNGFPTALHRGVEIGPSLIFNPAAAYMAYVAEGYAHPPACPHEANVAGNWTNVRDRYLGVEFPIKGKTHYGWALISVQVLSFRGNSWISTQLTGYAYETIPGKSIKAGQKKESADDPTNEDLDPSAYMTNPIPDKPQPASLAVLALGSQGVPLWWRKESPLEGGLKGAL